MKLTTQSIILSVILLLVLSPSILKAQDKTETLTLNECLQLAVQNNYTLRTRQLSVGAARDKQATAFNIDRTTFDIIQDPSSGGSPDNSFVVSQNFEFPTVYGSRHSYLKAQTGLEKSKLAFTRSELKKQVSGMYYNLLFIREKIRILYTQDSIYSEFVRLADAKYKSGETGRLESINAHRLYNENLIAIDNAKKDWDNMQIGLQHLLCTDQLITPRNQRLSKISFSIDSLHFAAAESPFAKIFEHKNEISRKFLSLQKQQFLPAFSLSFKSQLLIKGFNPYHIDRPRFPDGNFMGFEVGVSLPIFFGERRGNLRAAAKENIIATLEHQDAVLSIQKQFEKEFNSYRQCKKNLDYYIRTGNDEADDMARISKLSYEKGSIGYVEYIRNLESVADIRMQYIEALNQYNQEVINLLYLQPF